MRLKRREHVEWRDLPKVESPYFARAWVDSNVHVSGHAPNWVQGLDDVIWDDLSHNRHVWDDQARKRLLERLANAEVFLVHGYASDPTVPVVRRLKGEKGETLKIESSLSLDAQFNVQRMLDHAIQTRAILEPIRVPKAAPKPEPKKKEEPEELAVTNPRWEHVDEQRKENSPDATIAGDTVTLMVDVTGVSDGTRVTFKVFDTSISPPSRIAAVRGEVEGGIGKCEWKVRSPYEEAKVEFTGEARRIMSEQAEIPVISALSYLFSF